MQRTVAVASLLVLLTTPALAQNKVDGAYDVKFEEMSTNCDPVRFSYTRGVVKIDTFKGTLRVNIETIPQMNGVPGKSGKVTAKMTKKLATTVQGLDGKYSVSGRVDDGGVLQLVLVGEFSKTGETKTLCTQSWNLSGVRTAAADKPSDKKTKKSATDLLLPSLMD